MLFSYFALILMKYFFITRYFRKVLSFPVFRIVYRIFIVFYLSLARYLLYSSCHNKKELRGFCRRSLNGRGVGRKPQLVAGLNPAVGINSDVAQW